MVFVLIMLLAFTCDLAVKYGINTRWKDKEEQKLLKGTLLFRKMENSGLAMGKMQNHPKKILAFTGVLLVTVSACFFRSLRYAGNIFEKLGIGLMLGGGWNNWYDRLVKGSVTDYISINCRWQKLKRIVFNLSDALILLGTVVAAIGQIFGNGSRR